MNDKKEGPTISLEEGCWVIVDSGVFRLLGRLAQVDELPGTPVGIRAVLEDPVTHEIVSDVVRLDPVYELQLVSAVDDGKELVGLQASTFALLGIGGPVHARWQNLLFVSHLKEPDRHFLRGILQTAEEYKTILRASRARLVVVK